MNLGAFLADTDYIALLDADILLTEDFVKGAAGRLEKEPGVLISPVTFRGGKPEREMLIAGLSPTPRQKRHLHDDAGAFNWMRRSDFIDAGGLNTDFSGWGSEEREFEWRWKAQGRPFFRPGAYIHHLWHEREERRDKGYYENVGKNRRRLGEIKERGDARLEFKVTGVEVAPIQ